MNAGLARALLSWKHWPGLLAPLGTAGLLVAGAVGYSWLWPLPEAAHPAIPVAVVQGNIEQGVKWDPAWQGRTLAIYRELTREAARQHPQLIVWPEAAVPFFLREDPRWSEIETLAREAGAYLLVGAPDRQAGQPRNAAFLIGTEGRVLGRYDKRHLVPFGEYVPLGRVLFFVGPLADGAIDAFAPGREATVFSTPGGRFSVVICYEAIFPDEVRDFFLNGADFLVNITNDAWFGRSAAPVQHLAMAAFRAAENRAYLIRAANTGISAIVAPDGRIVQASALFTPAVLSATITPRAEGSFYTRYGDLFAWGTVGVTFAAVLVTLVPSTLPRWDTANQRLSTSRPGLRSVGWGRRNLLLWLPVGVGAIAAGWLSGLRASSSSGRGYQEVARWKIPEGEGRFIVVGPEPTPAKLRALGERLREELCDLDNAVVMVFDDPEAARAVRQGSRVIAEERFQRSLAHQRAMYLKSTARGEESLTIYNAYPGVREVIRY